MYIPVVSQYFATEAENEYVIRGNSGIMKCKIPSFVADFVLVDAWISDTNEVYTRNDTQMNYGKVADYGKAPYPQKFHPRLILLQRVESFWVWECVCYSVVAQTYEAEADNEYVIRGNAAIMKCEVPSFVSDFVIVEMWSDSQGGTYYPGANDGKGHAIKKSLRTNPKLYSSLLLLSY